jgi:hypothetical protein
VDTIVGSNHAQIKRTNVNFFLDGNALGLLQVIQRAFHQFGQVVRQVPMTHSLKIVVVGILSHPSVQKGPRQVVDSVLLVFNCFGHDFSVEMIVKAMVQMALDGQWFVQELEKKETNK